MTGVRAPPARCRPSLLSRSVASRRESGGGRGVLPAFGEMLCERVMVGEKCRHSAGVENEDLVLFGPAAGGVMGEKTGECLTAVDRVEEYSLRPCDEQYGIETCRGGVAILTSDEIIMDFKILGRRGRRPKQLAEGCPPLGEVFVALAPAAVDTNSDDGGGDSLVAQCEQQRGKDPASAERQVDGVRMPSRGVDLLGELQAAPDVPETTVRGGSADRNVVGTAAPLAQFLAQGQGLWFEIPMVLGVDHADVRAQ